jgi:hypothetical protein
MLGNTSHPTFSGKVARQMRDLPSKQTWLFSFLPPTLTQFSFGNHILDKAGRNSDHVRLKSALGGRFRAPDLISTPAGLAEIPTRVRRD